MARTINLGDPADNSVDFSMARAGAINLYATLEQSLAQLLSDLIGPDPTIGYTIFFQISNSRARLRIIEEFVEKRHGDTFKAFFNGEPRTKNKSGLIGVLKQPGPEAE